MKEEVALLREIIFWLFVISTIWTDAKYGKIFNIATFSVAGVGLIFSIFSAGWGGIISSVIGLAAGLALLGWVYYLGGAGGGDVKFLGAMGALMGYEFVIIGALWGFIIAGVAAMVFVIFKKQFLKTWGSVFDMVKNFLLLQGSAPAGIRHNPNLPAMPYGVYLCIGFALYRIYLYRWSAVL